MKIVGCILAMIGLVCIVKHVMHREEGCCLCGWHKKEGEEKPAGAPASHKIKVE
jgi:hypothetical protein